MSERAQTPLKLIEFYSVPIIEVIRCVPGGSTNVPREKKNSLKGSTEMVEKTEVVEGEQSCRAGTPTPIELRALV